MSNDLSNITFNTRAATSTVSIKNLVLMSSGPEALCTSRFGADCMVMPEVVTSIFSMTRCGLGPSLGISSSSLVNTDLK